ncbi:MAG TPA: DNA polymerase domain-containing protein [Thermoplasmata archaeon]|jgi:DNA polymerase I
MSESWDIRMLTASYRRDGPHEEPVIELFGRTRDGKSITVEYWGFLPYFYCIEPTQALRTFLLKDPEVVRIDDVELEVSGVNRKCGKVVIHHPWKTPEYRERCRKYGSEVLAADIPFAHRFIYDFDLPSCFRVVGTPTKGRYTTDLIVRAEKFEPAEPFNPRLKVLSFDIENGIQDPTILCIGLAWREDASLRTECLSGTEREIIRGFIDIVQKLDPDVITGYNIDGYDLPVLEARGRMCGIVGLPLSRDGQTISNIGERFWRTHGRIIADAWWSVKLELHPKQETLDAVAKWLLGEGKHDVDRRNIEQEWAKDKERVMEYCKKDAELALRVLEKVSRLDKSLDLALVSKLPVDDVFNGRTSQLIDSILIRAADRGHFGVPMTRQGRGEASIEGGYVHSLDPGLYEWVAVLDFTSMYPSIIIENNICFTTLNDHGTVISPTGVRFLDRSARVGLLPQILGNLMGERREVKAKLKTETDPEKRAYYDRLQFAVKILMNAFYGVLASSFYRFTNPQIGASITAFARENIKKIIAQLESEGIRVIYADTDSVFFESPEKNLDGTIKIGRRIAERFSHGSVNMEFERVLETFFSHGKKKRYAAKVAWPVAGELIVRGYEIRRTDAFNLQGEAQKRVFSMILDKDIDGAVKFARDSVLSVKAGQVPPEFLPEEGDPVEPLVISRTVREETRYANPESMANVQAANKLKAMGEEVMPGMKVSWVVVDARRSPMEVEPYISGRPFTRIPDWDYYARRIAQTLSYVTEIYGWDEKALYLGTQQATLFHENFAEKPRKAAPVRTDKKLTLEDFL